MIAEMLILPEGGLIEQVALRGHVKRGLALALNLHFTVQAVLLGMDGTMV